MNDVPVTVVLLFLALSLFVSGGFLIFKAKNRVILILAGILLIGLSSFIFYGLDVQCQNVLEFRKC